MSKIKGTLGLVSGGASLSGLQTATFSLRPPMTTSLCVGTPGVSFSCWDGVPPM